MPARKFQSVGVLLAPCFSLLCCASAQAAPPRVDVYLSAPGALGVPNFAGAVTTVETFSQTAGLYNSSFSSAIGTYELSAASAFRILADDEYGSGYGQYMSFGAQSGTTGAFTLNFGKSISYFGFSWNAGDANNGVTFYDGTTLIGRYSTANTLNLLQNATVTSLDGTTYQSSSYKGKPNGGTPNQNTNENYGYLSFFAVDTTFDRVVFDNSGATTGFESDNHTILASGTATRLGSFVSVSQAIEPEPGTFALILPIAGAGVVYVRKRRHAKL